jgi:hypothetical protein
MSKFIITTTKIEEGKYSTEIKEHHATEEEWKHLAITAVFQAARRSGDGFEKCLEIIWDSVLFAKEDSNV